MNTADMKILWGRAANICAMCRTRLTDDAENNNDSFLIGEHAHIVGQKLKKKRSPRSDSPLSEEDRDKYANHILLCANCHTTIDKNEDDYPIEKLHLIKSEHEQWVINTLSETIDHVRLAHTTSAAFLVDDTVRLCGMEFWQEWVQTAMKPVPFWYDDQIDRLSEFHQRIMAMVWPPEMEEFQYASELLSLTLYDATDIFMQHAEPRGKMWVPIPFYKLIPNNPNYDRDVDRYQSWLKTCYSQLRQATKAANWFADVVRRDINPMFFVKTGRFLVEEGPFSDLTHRAYLPLFSEDEISEFISLGSPIAVRVEQEKQTRIAEQADNES